MVVVPGDQRVSPALKAREVYELLVEHYRMVPAPAASREVLAWMHAASLRVISKEPARTDVIVPFASRRPHRLRYLVAATIAGAFAMSGLAAAGALPDPLQRGAATVASVVAIDLPTPDVRHRRIPSPHPEDVTGSATVSPASPLPDTGAGTPHDAPALTPSAGVGADSIPSPTVPSPGDGGAVARLDFPVPELPPLAVPQSQDPALPSTTTPDPLVRP
jgi:hypothetical protein